MLLVVSPPLLALLVLPHLVVLRPLPPLVPEVVAFLVALPPEILIIRKHQFLLLASLDWFLLLALAGHDAAVDFASVGSDEGLAPAAEDPIYAVVAFHKVHLDALRLGDLLSNTTT